jgi:putative DNA primase/helicase
MSDRAPSSLTLASSTREEVPKYYNSGIYNMSDKGLYALINKKKGRVSILVDRLISAAFEILGRVRDLKGEGWARLLRWRDKDQRTHTYAVSDNDLHGDHRVLFGNLAGRGLHIVTNKDRTHLIHYLNSVEVVDRVTEVPYTGWHGVGSNLVFALTEQTIGEIDGETIIVRGTTDNSPFERCGTLDQWKKGVGSLVAGHSRPIFCVSAALAGPLLGPLGIEGGGFNLFGKSSIGKTSAECAAASVWGKGAVSPGFIRLWRATANSLEAVAAIHTDTMLALDELSVVEAKEAAASVYSLASGAGKGRSNRDGSARRSLIWRIVILSTGEVRLTDKLIEDKRKPRVGQQVRLVDIPADAGQRFGVFDSVGAEGSSQALADKIKEAAQTYYGSAGPEFVRKLIADTDYNKIKQMVEAFRDHAPEGADSQVLRVLDRFGLVAAAGELAIQFGIVPWETAAAIKAAKDCFDAWFEDRGGADAGEDMAAVAAVRFFIERHGEARFEPAAGIGDGLPIRDRAGWRRGEGDAREWLIPPEVWKQEVCAGHNATAVAKALAERGMLKQDTEGRHSRSERVREGEKMRVYVVTSKILAGE